MEAGGCCLLDLRQGLCPWIPLGSLYIVSVILRNKVNFQLKLLLHEQRH